MLVPCFKGKVFLHLFQLCYILCDGETRTVCSSTNVALSLIYIDLHSGIMISTVLFSTPFLMIPNMEETDFFTAAEHCVDIFITRGIAQLLRIKIGCINSFQCICFICTV